jgi:hypothetical protein
MKLSIFNPFTKIAGSKALLIGLGFIIATIVIGYYSNMHFDGAIDAHLKNPSPILNHALQHLIAWGSVVILFFLAGLILSRSRFRFIDVAGTIALARAPMLLVAIIGFAPAFQNAIPGQITNAVLILLIIVIIPTIWMIALMYHAFIISINVKGTKATIGFIISLVLAEILSISLNQQFLLR